ncbi:hypothetical protein T01_10001 [Trichinella spiralis]|uniref:Uncharacterized protein n=1 Tax=Trichinella spiralis TaxID=6334 RepID=A0A0V1AWD6_TRISP|nr:hypothetical protein T01_10001 [Trichinella spiralis]
MRSLPACVICNDEFGPNLQSRRTTVASWSKQTVGRSVSFKERQILAALKLFVFGQACKVWPLSSLDTGAESTAATAKLKRSADGVKKKAWSRKEGGEEGKKGDAKSRKETQMSMTGGPKNLLRPEMTATHTHSCAQIKDTTGSPSRLGPPGNFQV